MIRPIPRIGMQIPDALVADLPVNVKSGPALRDCLEYVAKYYADCIIIALKSRSNPAAEAVAMSVAALDWLRQKDAKQFYFKYCSTFDSTDKGNIGPVADAMMDALGAGFTVFNPSFPTNKRTV